MNLPALTSLRAFAAAMVVVYHLSVTLDTPWLAQVSGGGFMAVGLFFVLSGFVMVVAYAGRGVSPVAYWRRRLQVLYPLYALGLLLSLGAFLTSSATLQTAVLAPLLLQAWVPESALAWNGPGWSLSVEAFFYLLFPALLPLILRARWSVLTGLAAMLWAASVALAGYGLVTLGDVGRWDFSVPAFAIRFNPLAHLPAFVIGMIAARWFLEHRPALPHRLPLLAGLLTVLAFLAGPHVPFLLAHNGLFIPVWVLLLIALTGVRDGFMVHPGLVALGHASYGLYILHLPLWGLVGHALPKHAVTVLVFLTFAFLVVFAAEAAIRYLRQQHARRLIPAP